MVIIQVIIAISVVVSALFMATGPFAALRQRRLHERETLEDLAEHYIAQGIDASLFQVDSPEASAQGLGIVRRLIGFLVGTDAGYMQIRGLNYDLVTVRLGVVSRRTHSTSVEVGFFSYDSTSEEIPVEYHHVLQVSARDERALRANLKKKTKGLFSKEMVDVGWRGGELATMLDSQTELNRLITRVLTPKDDLKVVYDRKNSFARIILTLPGHMWRRRVLFSRRSEIERRLPCAEMVDAVNQIAGLIRQGSSNASSS